MQEGQIIDFIEIDKNALLYMCDLLGIEAVEGEIVKNIIEKLQSINYANTNNKDN